MSAKPAIPQQTERAFMADFREQAIGFSWLYYHTFNSMYSAPGFPDCTLVKGGRVLFVELKRVGGKLTADQERWLAALREAGAETYLWTPDDWPEIIHVLTGKEVIG